MNQEQMDKKFAKILEQMKADPLLKKLHDHNSQVQIETQEELHEHNRRIR